MLTKTDKKEVEEIFNNGLTTVVMPVLDRILDKLDEHSEDLKTLKENVHSLQLTTNRIEMLQHHELDRVDDHEVRITRLEKVKK